MLPKPYQYQVQEGCHCCSYRANEEGSICHNGVSRTQPCLPLTDVHPAGKCAHFEEGEHPVWRPQLRKKENTDGTS